MIDNIIKSAKILWAMALVFVLCGFSDSRGRELIPTKVLKKISIPKRYHEGLYFDGKNIWVNNGEKGKTWVVDTSSGSIVKEIEPAGTFTESVTSMDGNRLFVTDWELKKIYAARVVDGRMVAESEASVAPAHPAGAMWNGVDLFVITWTRSLYGTKFHLLKMDEKFNTLSKFRIKNIAEPAHLAWDGRNLWIACWYTQRVFKMDGLGQKILGYFKSPAANTTGVAWDGANFWVTGTYADLYKIELQN